MGGFANHIEIALLPNNRVRVADNGRGIPVDIHKKTKVSALETVMTTLHAGGKFGGAGYKVSGGLHGRRRFGSERFRAMPKWEVHRDGGLYAQEYEKGKRKAAVKKSPRQSFMAQSLLLNRTRRFLRKLNGTGTLSSTTCVSRRTW